MGVNYSRKIKKKMFVVIVVVGVTVMLNQNSVSLNSYSQQCGDNFFSLQIASFFAVCSLPHCYYLSTYFACQCL